MLQPLTSWAVPTFQIQVLQKTVAPPPSQVVPPHQGATQQCPAGPAGTQQTQHNLAMVLYHPGALLRHEPAPYGVFCHVLNHVTSKAAVMDSTAVRRTPYTIGRETPNDHDPAPAPGADGTPRPPLVNPPVPNHHYHLLYFKI